MSVLSRLSNILNIFFRCQIWTELKRRKSLNQRPVNKQKTEVNENKTKIGTPVCGCESTIVIAIKEINKANELWPDINHWRYYCVAVLDLKYHIF